MNKSEFISAVAEKSGLSKADAKKAVDAFIETVSSELKAGGKVALLGFGSFSISEKEEGLVQMLADYAEGKRDAIPSLEEKILPFHKADSPRGQAMQAFKFCTRWAARIFSSSSYSRLPTPCP